MLHLFRPRSELQALKQLTASLPISTQGSAGRGSANWVEVQREWTSREQKAVRDDARIAELERELESARLMLAEADASARASETCLLYTSPSPRDQRGSRMPSSA